MRETCRQLEEDWGAGQDPKELALKLAAEANAKRAAAQRILAALEREDQEKGKK